MNDTFSNNQIKVNGLPNLDAIKFTPLNSRYGNVILIRLTIIVLVLTVIGCTPLFAHDFIPELELPMGLQIAAIAFTSILSLLIVVVNLLGFKKKGYAIRERDIIYKSGLINRTETVIPFNRVQHVGIYESALLRVFDLCTVEFFTAGGAMGDLKIPGLSKEDGDRLKAYVIQNINQENKTVKSSEHNTAECTCCQEGGHNTCEHNTAECTCCQEGGHDTCENNTAECTCCQEGGHDTCENNTAECTCCQEGGHNISEHSCCTEKPLSHTNISNNA
ncbi:PH domain-containing protein [Myroides phaeus]|uniref:Membrane protein YdbS, contains bPH2 (Pleckstrin homology) domain n=1 Tax=Myroides phaeus TaxID=702745 RepID=A0A1G8CNF4_9FLAO|nr:PH domain-containing protein [Myroides phaeus]SDH47077.1 membrane protein YdbS, contains bPH2 (pleckstrin homology) domain [Myroides phaeus]